MFSLKEILHTSRPIRPALVEGLLVSGTINLLVGDTGIGKTPLGLQLGLAVASGEMFLNHETHQGAVLYIDAESPWEGFKEPLANLTKFLGIPEEIPFYAYNRDWDEREVLPASWEPLIEEQLEAKRPALVIIDPLRAIWPLAETKTDECMKVISLLRKWAKAFGSTFLITHHVRKDSQEIDPRNKPDLLEDPQGWLQAAAGTRALVTSADTRIAVAKPSSKDIKESDQTALLLSGYTRLKGAIPPKRLERVFLQESPDEPVGYKILISSNGISKKQIEALKSLPNPFRITDLRDAIHSTKGAYELAKKLEGGGLVIKDERLKLYHKDLAALAVL